MTSEANSVRVTFGFLFPFLLYRVVAEQSGSSTDGSSELGRGNPGAAHAKGGRDESTLVVSSNSCSSN